MGGASDSDPSRREVSVLLGVLGGAIGLAALSGCAPRETCSTKDATSGGGVPNALTIGDSSGIAIGATTMTVTPSLTTAQATAFAARVWVALDAYSPNCEVVLVTLASRSLLTFTPATLKAHPHGALVTVLEEGIVTPQLFGARPNATTDVTGAVIAAANTGTGTIRFPAAIYKLSSNVVFPGAQTLTFSGGAILEPDLGTTVTIHGNVLAPPTQQIFGGAGAIVISNSGTISVQWFGADPSGGVDSSQAFNAAVAAKEAAGGGTIYVPRGYYKVTEPIDFGAKACVIKGDGWGFKGLGDFAKPAHSYGSIIASTLAVPGSAAFTVAAKDSVTAQVGVKFQDLALVSSTWSGTVQTPATGLSLKRAAGTTNVSIDNVYIAGFAIGFMPGTVEEGSFKDLVCWSNVVGAQIDGSGNNQCTWTNFQANANDVGLKIMGGEQHQFLGGLIQGNRFKGVHFQAGVILEFGFRGIWFEQNNNGNHDAEGGDIVYELNDETPGRAALIGQVRFDSCHFGGGSDGLIRKVQFVRRGERQNSSTYVQIQFCGCYALGESLSLPSYSVLSSVVDSEFGGTLIDAGKRTAFINSRAGGVQYGTQVPGNGSAASTADAGSTPPLAPAPIRR